MSMTRKELIKTLSTKTSSTHANTLKFLDALSEVVTTELSSGRDLQLRGIGKLSRTLRAARTGVNPLTLEKINIDSMFAVKFSCSSTLKSIVRASK